MAKEDNDGIRSVSDSNAWPKQLDKADEIQQDNEMIPINN